MAKLAVLLLFFISGISGLVYQVIWVREFGFIFGSTVQSASLVTAVFMGGLGLGSYFIGHWSDRRHADDPRVSLASYGYFEIAIAVLGALVSLVLPSLEGLSASFTSYEVGPSGWHEITNASHIIRFTAASLLLAPITFLMGGTLTLLIRYLLLSDFNAIGWKVGLLYGLNTAGAAVGAFMSDFALVPSFGVQGTQAVAVGLNLVSGIGALILVRSGTVAVVHSSAGSAITRQKTLPHSDPTAKEGSTLIRGAALTLFVSGFVAMGIEMLWFRYLINGLGGFRAVFSLMMTVILSGIFIGALLGGFVERRTGAPAKIYIIAQMLMIVTTLIPMGLLGAHIYAPFDSVAMITAAGESSTLLQLAGIGINLQSIAIIVAVPALLMGFAFPLANAHVQTVQTSIGGKAGALYLSNTLGNVCGSLAAGFILLPLFGQFHSFTLLAFLGIAGLVPLYLTDRARHPWHTFAKFLGTLCVVAFCFTLYRWVGLPDDHLLRNTRPLNPGHKVLAVSEGINENIVIVDEGGDGRRLYTNGHSMSSTAILAQRYMRLFTHLPLLNIEQPEKALIICFGVGSTAHSVSLYDSMQEIEIADLSRNVLSHAKLFSASNNNVLNDPRVQVFVNDGRQHLRLQPEESYDLITLEPPPIAHAGIAALYSVEFYELAKSRLKTNGYMTQWLPAYQVNKQANLAIVKAFLDVFPNAVLLSGMKRELILMAAKEGETYLDSSKILSNLSREPAVKEDLERIGAHSITEMAATFAGGPQTLARATEDSASVTDDFPMMEYSQVSATHRVRLPATLFNGKEIANWCPDCFNGKALVYGISELPALSDAMQEYYQSDKFLNHASNIPNYVEKTEWSGTPCLLRVVARNFYYQDIFECRR